MRPTRKDEDNAAVIWAHAAIDAMVDAGLRDVFVSPGSRSTPLVAAVVDDPRLRDHSVIDERSSAFAALGAAQASGRPVALVCTSGTATANFYAAICEADSARVPLLVLTADRPPTLRESGASQAMRQVGMYGDKVRWAHDLAMPSVETDDLRYVQSIARRAFAIARDEQGPVHLNFPFAKPLEPNASREASSGPDFVLPRNGSSGGVYQRSFRAPDPVALTNVVRQLESASRPVILVGSSRTGHEWARVLCEVAERIGAPVIAEATSQLRFGESARSVVPGDVLLSNAELAGTLRPDVVLRLGMPSIDWPVIRWANSLDATRIVVSSAYDSDPQHDVDSYFVCDELAFLEALRRRFADNSPPSPWRERFSTLAADVIDHVRAEMAEAPLIDGRVAHDLINALPSGAALVLSSSMPLREVEAFGMPRLEPLHVYCNRGLNGIDGVIATAHGVATQRDEPTVLLIGDVAVAHDIGSLQLGKRLGVDLTIVLVDNAGGAIFDHLPVAGMQPMYDRHFVTEPGLDWAGAAELFGISVETLEDVAALPAALEASFERDGTSIIVAKTDSAQSKSMRDAIMTGFDPGEA